MGGGGGVVWTDCPVWIAIQILINRASLTGGAVYLPAPTPDEFRTGRTAGPHQSELPSYNLGNHHLVVLSGVTLYGDSGDGDWIAMLEDHGQPENAGMVNLPPIRDLTDPTDQDGNFVDDDNNFIGSAPRRGTIVEHTGTTGPVIRVFRARNAHVSNLWLVARNLARVTIDLLEDPFTPRLYFMLGLFDGTNWSRVDWYPVDGPDAPVRDPANNRWSYTWTEGTERFYEAYRFYDWSEVPKDDDTHGGRLQSMPLMGVRWFRDEEEYDPEADAFLYAEKDRAYEDYTNCVLHVNAAWHSTFENLNFFIPRRSVAILVDCYRDGAMNPYSWHDDGTNTNTLRRYYLYDAVNDIYPEDTNNNDYYSVFSPYIDVRDQDHLVPDDEDNPEQDGDLTVNVGAGNIGSMGAYQNDFRTMHAITGLIVLYGNSTGDAVTTSTFQDIWARRYVVRNAMSIDFLNAGAEQFNGNCPAFDFPHDLLDERIFIPGTVDLTHSTDPDDQAILEGWWYLIRKELLMNGRRYFDGREMGYLIEDAENVTLTGLDIEENAGRVMIMLGERVKTFTATGITAGSSALGPKASLIGRPTVSGSLTTSNGPGATWGQKTTDLTFDCNWTESSESIISIGKRLGNQWIPWSGFPFQYVIRSYNPEATGEAPVSTASNAEDRRREALEIAQIRRHDESSIERRQLMVFDRSVYANPGVPGGNTNTVTLIRIDAGKGGDGDEGRVEVNSSRIVLDGTVEIVETDTNGAFTVPSSAVTGLVNNSPTGWMRIRVRNTGGQETYVYVPFFQ